MEFVEPLYGLLVLSVVLFLAILASKTSGRLGVPALILFMALGWIFGPEGLNLIHLPSLEWLRYVGVVALSLILFSGGLDTRFDSVRPVMWRGTSLATLGVLLTAVVTAVAAYFIFPFTPAEAFLFGAIVSSTDAAAVFSVLRSKSIGLKHKLRPLLELESSSNDPMALMLTTAAIAWIIGERESGLVMGFQLVYQLVVGAAMGILVGYVTLWFINRLSLQYEGLFSVLILSAALFTYSTTDLIQANGLLAVYCAGVVIGNKPFVHRQSTLKFFDGLAWLMQILIFVSLGIILSPRALWDMVIPGILISLVLIFVSRPVGVFLSLLPFRKVGARDKVFISWVGLKGAAPLVFALYPLLAVEQGVSADVGQTVLNAVYFVVILSVVLQGTLLTRVAEWLGLALPMPEKTFYPLAMEQRDNFQSLLQEIQLPEDSPAIGKSLVGLNLPTDSLIILISRGDQFVMPNGSTELHAHDKLLVLATTQADLEGVYQRLGMFLPEST